jgi:cardiolipin synthase
MSFLLMSYFLEMSWGVTWWTVLWWGGTIVALLHIPSVLMGRGTRPMAVLAWILCLISLPILGVILWWLIGRRHVERRQRRWERSQADMTRSLAEVRDTITQRHNLPSDGLKRRFNDGGRPMRSSDLFYLRPEEGVFAATRGNRVQVFPSGAQAFDGFEAAVRDATEHIHFEFYIWQNDSVGRRFRDLLTEKARQGVEVRVLYDAVGGSAVNRGFMEPLIAAGAKVAAFLPLSFFERQLRVNFRNHRKIIVIDGQVGFTGGLNIGEEYLDWVDLAFRLDGPAALQLQEVFAEDWYFATGEDLGSPQYFLPAGSPDSDQYALMSCQYVPDSIVGPRPLGGELSGESAGEGAEDSSGAEQNGEVVPASPPGVCESVTARIIASGPDKPDSVIENVFFLAMTGAAKRIFLTTPYFVPDHAILMAIKTAAIRGVDVRILTAGVTDVWLARAAGRSHYEDLMQAGVRIFEYDDRMLHAKAIVIDDDWSIVGSANMDIRSFLLNFEVNAILGDPHLTAYMADLFETHLSHSTEIQLADYTNRSLKNRLIESTARLFSPLL